MKAAHRPSITGAVSDMVIHHFAAMVLFAFLVSVVFGVLSKDTLRQRILYATRSFVLFVAIAVLLGWIMYPFPR